MNTRTKRISRWIIGGMAFFVVVIIIAILNTDVPEPAAEDVAIEEAKRSDKKAAQAEIDATIEAFATTETAMVEASGGVITNMEVSNNGMYLVEVYVDEAMWASSSESEKQSFATSIGTAVQSALPDSALVDFLSATNNDIVADGKPFGGYEIKR